MKIFATLFLALVLSGCAAQVSPTPLPAQGDSFFSAQAWLDANANGQLDSADMPLENITLKVRLENGAEFGARTNAEGRAFVTVPGGAQYPVTLTMEAPADSGLQLLEPLRARLEAASGETIAFLFAKK